MLALPSYATIFVFVETRSAKTAYVLPSTVPGCIHYYSFTTIYKSLPDEVQISKPNATIQPSDSGPLVRRRDRLLHPPPQADHLAPQEEYSSNKSHWDRESENDPPRPKNCWRGQNRSKSDFVRALWLCRRLKFSFVGLFLIKFLKSVYM